MPKVLMSFLGTSQEDMRAYKSATYRFTDGWQMESTFIASVLKTYYHTDRMILMVEAIISRVCKQKEWNEYNQKHY